VRVRPSAFQAWRIRSCHELCERSRLSPIAAYGGWSLLLSSLLSVVVLLS
jgi:hypothetical protein